MTNTFADLIEIVILSFLFTTLRCLFHLKFGQYLFPFSHLCDNDNFELMMNFQIFVIQGCNFDIDAG